MSFCVVIPGGEDPGMQVIERALRADLVIAADSGLDHARRHGIEPDVLVGDMDSVEPDSIASFEGKIERHSPDKDQTDLALALDHALTTDATHIEVLGGGGGRFDHLIANCVVLAAPRFQGVSIRWHLRDSVTTVVRDSVELRDSHGEIVTLLAIGGDAYDVSIDGVRWPLESVTLSFGSSWGVSNEMIAPTANLTVGIGTVLAIQATDR